MGQFCYFVGVGGKIKLWKAVNSLRFLSVNKPS